MDQYLFMEIDRLDYRQKYAAIRALYVSAGAPQETQQEITKLFYPFIESLERESVEQERERIEKAMYQEYTMDGGPGNMRLTISNKNTK